MIDDRCQRYLEDPEAHASHLDECAACRALHEGFATSSEPSIVARGAFDAGNLPLAPWEGASHRAWPLVIGGVVVVVAMALALCAAAGISPLGVARNIFGQVNTARGVIDDGARWFNQSTMWRLAFGAIFIAVNALFVALLRRSPRGVDV